MHVVLQSHIISYHHQPELRLRSSQWITHLTTHIQALEARQLIPPPHPCHLAQDIRTVYHSHPRSSKIRSGYIARSSILDDHCRTPAPTVKRKVPALCITKPSNSTPPRPISHSPLNPPSSSLSPNRTSERRHSRGNSGTGDVQLKRVDEVVKGGDISQQRLLPSVNRGKQRAGFLGLSTAISLV